MGAGLVAVGFDDVDITLQKGLGRLGIRIVVGRDGGD
jgi:hypothetical protein